MNTGIKKRKRLYPHQKYVEANVKNVKQDNREAGDEITEVDDKLIVDDLDIMEGETGDGDGVQEQDQDKNNY